MKSDHPWTDTDIARLRLGWAKGLSCSAIGREIGVSKNAVVGKVRRLDLPGRPSPIHPSKDGPRPPKPKRVIGPTLAPIVGETAEVTTQFLPRLSNNLCSYPIGTPRRQASDIATNPRC